MIFSERKKRKLSGRSPSYQAGDGEGRKTKQEETSAHVMHSQSKEDTYLHESWPEANHGRPGSGTGYGCAASPTSSWGRAGLSPPSTLLGDASGICKGVTGGTGVSFSPGGTIETLHAMQGGRDCAATVSAMRELFTRPGGGTKTTAGLGTAYGRKY